MFTSEELKYAARILNFFAPEPTCVCGSKQFKIGIKKNILYGYCLKCKKQVQFDGRTRKWMFTYVPPSITNTHEGIIEK